MPTPIHSCHSERKSPFVMHKRQTFAPKIKHLLVAFGAFLLCSVGFVPAAHAVGCGSTEAGFLASTCHNTSVIATSTLLTKQDILNNISIYEEWGFTREWVEAQEVTVLSVEPGVNWVACSNNGPDGLCRRSEGDTFISGPMTYTFGAGTTFHVLGTAEKWIALMCGNFKLPDVPPTESDAKKVSFDVLDWPTRIDADTNVAVTVRVVLEATGNRATNDVTDFIRVTGPADCTISTVAPIEATLVNGVPQTFDRSVTLNCANPSNHEFTFTDDLIGQAGVLDRNLANNHMSFARSTEVFDDSDLSVAATTLVCDDSTKVATSFTCTGATTAHNAGPYGPTNADVTLVLSGLSDCTITPLQGEDLIGVALPLQGDIPLERSWSVECTDRSNHPFQLAATVIPEHIHVEDHDTGNNTQAASDVTEVFQDTDLEVAITDLDCTEREHNTANSACVATVAISNAGDVDDSSWADNVKALTDVQFTGAPGCTVTPMDNQPTSAILVKGTTQVLTARVAITCTDAIRHSVKVVATLANDPVTDPHAVDTDTTSAQWNPSDIKPRSLPSAINLRKEGLIPFALLGTQGFNPMTDVQFGTVRFGVTGTEDTVERCASSGEDVNDDGLMDAVCFARVTGTGLVAETTTVKITGLLTDGAHFFSQDAVKILA